MAGETSKELLGRLRNADADAAREIFDRYARRLMALVKKRISPQLARRFEPEDVLQSAYRTFFAHGRNGDYVLERAGDLWRLLAAITLNKLRGQIERHTAMRRDFRQEMPAACQTRGSVAVPLQPADGEPSPAEAAAILDELQATLTGCSHDGRRVLEMRLRGETVETIARGIGRSQRTVRRLLEEVRSDLETRLMR